MKFGILKTHYSDEGCGNSENELSTSKNIKQLEDIASKMNKKYGSREREFYVTIIDTNEIKESLSRKDISNLWN